MAEILSQEAVNAGKFLTFALAGEEYGIKILKVREIIGFMVITRVPRAPYYVKGVINLRGQVIPVVDLRLKFGMEEAKITEKTCIIVVEGFNGEVSVPVGIVVDSVSEVLDINGEAMEPPPDLGGEMDRSNILALAKLDGAVKTLLDADRVLFGDASADVDFLM